MEPKNVKTIQDPETTPEINHNQKNKKKNLLPFNKSIRNLPLLQR